MTSGAGGVLMSLGVTMQRYLSFGYLAAIIGGLLLALGNVVAVPGSSTPFSAQVLTAPFVVSAALRLAGVTLMMVGLTAIYVRMSDRAGAFGLVAYALVMVNLVLQAGTMFADLFVTGALAANAPAVLDGAVDDSRLSMAFLLAWVFNTTLVLLGIATLRARVFSKVVGWSFIVMGAITVVPLPVDGPVYEIVIGAACVLAGVYARRVSPVIMDGAEEPAVLASA
jgi:hypothetical protein